MPDIHRLIRERRSVRTFDANPLDEQIRTQLTAYAETITNPFHQDISIRLLKASEHGLTSPVVSGTDWYAAGKVHVMPFANAAFGYSFEKFVLYAQSLGLGTVWIGGTFNRASFEQAMALSKDEMMPCASPIGFPARKMTLREGLMRKAIKADERIAFSELFYHHSFDTPLHPEEAGDWADPLEMVRLAPSAVNKQPWRVVVTDQAAHFYLKRSKGFKYSDTLDMQMIDVGIALCHFEMTCTENGLAPVFFQKDPGYSKDEDLVYIASYSR